MTQKELVEQLFASGSGIEEFIYDADKESLRRLVLELDYVLYDTVRRLAREMVYDFGELKLDVYSALASNLTDAFTFGTGEWTDETSIS